MTVPTLNSVAEFVTNGVTTNFPFFFKFLAIEDLVVTYVDPVGVSSVLTLGTQYTVNGAGNDSGSIVTNMALAGPGQLIVSRELDAYQQTSLRNQGKFLAETHEDVFDRLTMLIQQGFAIFKRALTRPFGRDYFFAENRRITNVKDPVEQQDAATVAWTDRFVAGLIGAITGPINNALNIFFKGPDGSSHVVQDLTGRTTGNGADLITLGAANVVGDLARESVDLGASLLPGAVRSIPTVADLRLLTGTRADQIVLLEVDGSGAAPGLFKWTPASVLADDGYQVVKPTATVTGRWIRFYMESSVTAPAAGIVKLYHYNIENDVASLELVKRFGFNTLHIYRSAPWMGSTSRSLAFLDRLARHGLRAVFMADNGVLAGSTTAPAYIAELAWINSIKNHHSLIGWANVDEAVASLVSIVIQERIKVVLNSVSTKLVHQTEGNTDIAQMDPNYTSNSYDVWYLDAYLDQGATNNDEVKFKCELVRRIFGAISYNGFNNKASKRAPRKIIPVLPLFSMTSPTVVNEPTKNSMRWMVEGWRPFVQGNSFGAFLHDLPSGGPEVFSSFLSNSQSLQNIVHSVNSLWGGVARYSLITTRGYSVNPEFISATNITSNGAGAREKMGPVAAGNYHVIGSHVTNPGASVLAIYACFIQAQDAATRRLFLEYSLDGTTWTIAGQVDFGALPAGQSWCFGVPWEGPVTGIRYRARIDMSVGAGVNDASTTGFLAIGCTSV